MSRVKSNSSWRLICLGGVRWAFGYARTEWAALLSSADGADEVRAGGRVRSSCNFQAGNDWFSESVGVGIRTCAGEEKG